MLVFLDFEASSLGKRSYPIEVGWVFADGTSEDHLIRPAPSWTEWDDKAEVVHGISRTELHEHGEPHDVVAQRMIEVLTGHDIVAGSPSWDGKWMSTLLRAASLPRHSLRLRHNEDAYREAAIAVLEPVVPPAELDQAVGDLLALCELRAADEPIVHRALPDARQEHGRWLAARQAAEELVAGHRL